MPMAFGKLQPQKLRMALLEVNGLCLLSDKGSVKLETVVSPGCICQIPIKEGLEGPEILQS